MAKAHICGKGGVARQGTTRLTSDIWTRRLLDYRLLGRQHNMDEPATVLDNPWVQCDKCQKWRRLPTTVDATCLPEQWFCKMNKWDSSRKRCTAPEEDFDESSEPLAPSMAGRKRPLSPGSDDDSSDDDIPLRSLLSTQRRPTALEGPGKSSSLHHMANGAKTNGAKSNVAKTNGAKGNGAKTNGAKTNGAKTNGAKGNVAKTNGAKTNDAKPLAKPRPLPAGALALLPPAAKGGDPIGRGTGIYLVSDCGSKGGVRGGAFYGVWKSVGGDGVATGELLVGRTVRVSEAAGPALVLRFDAAANTYQLRLQSGHTTAALTDTGWQVLWTGCGRRQDVWLGSRGELLPGLAGDNGDSDEQALENSAWLGREHGRRDPNRFDALSAPLLDQDQDQGQDGGGGEGEGPAGLPPLGLVLGMRELEGRGGWVLRCARCLSLTPPRYNPR